MLLAHCSFCPLRFCLSRLTSLRISPPSHFASLAVTSEAYYQESGRAGRDGLPSEAVVWWKPADYYRLACLAVDTSDRAASMRALHAAGEFCERESRCRRAHLADLFGQPLPPRGTAERPPHRCCDFCARTAQEHTGEEVPKAGADSVSEHKDVGSIGVDALRVLASLNAAAASEGGARDGGMAPAKLTAVKLCDKLGSKVSYGGSRLTRDALEHIVLRLVLSDAIQLHFAFTAYAVLSYLYVRPTLEHVLVRDQQATAVSLHLPPLARTLGASLLPQPAPAKAAPSRKRKEVARAAAPPEASSVRKKRTVPAESDDDSDVDGGLAAADDAEDVDDDDDVFEVAKPARRVPARQGASSSDHGRGVAGNTSGSNTGLRGAEVVVLE